MHHSKLPSKGLRFLVIVLLVLSVFLRVIHLDRKVYWADEVYTSIRLSGYTTAEIAQTVTQSPMTAEALQKFQHPDPTKGFAGTLHGLAIEEPQLPPLYYVMLRGWGQLFGNSVAVLRGFSVLLSLLTFPCLYWFCLELFGSALVGWMAIAIVAVSPLHLVYAQEARVYSLWMLTILLSSAALLRAIRVQTKASWLLYTLTVLASLYAYLLSAVILIGHGVYVLLMTSKPQPQIRQIFIPYVLSSLIGLLGFSPWVFIFLKYRVIEDEAAEKESLFAAVKHGAGLLSRAFVDFNLTSASPHHYLVLLMVATALLIVLVIYAFYFLIRHSPSRIWSFIVILTLAVLVAMLPRSLSPTMPARYLISTYLGIQLAIAYLLGTKLADLSTWRTGFWRLVTVLILSVGLLSCVVNVQAEGWWNKEFSNCNPQMARTINQSPTPLIISDLKGKVVDSALSNIISLSHQLKPTTPFQILPSQATLPKLADRYESIFVMTPSEHLRSSLEQTYKLEAIQTSSKADRDTKNVCLWKLKKHQASSERQPGS
jgi:uncharacterized membrane protein